MNEKEYAEKLITKFGIDNANKVVDLILDELNFLDNSNRIDFYLDVKNEIKFYK